MSPQKQAAQTANAQKSRGATTEAGRARSSQNSIRHSLCSKKYFIVPEERPEFDIYYNDLIAALAPEGAAESLLAEAIILDAWRLTRARLVENQIFFGGYMSAKQRLAAGAETWLAHSKELSTLTLYEQRIYRVLTHNKAEFASIQAARSGAGLPACALPTTQSQEPEAPPLPAQPAEPKPETAAQEQPVGFVHSSDLLAPLPVQPADSKPETAAPAQPAGFVHSSDVPPPTPDPQPLTPAAKQPAGFVRSSADSNGGFVRSNSPIASPEEPLAMPAEPVAEPQPASTPPATARRAA